MSKQISIFLDGTWNTPESQTNVYKLFSITQGYVTGSDLKDLEHSKWTQAVNYFKQKIFGAEIDHIALDNEYSILNEQKHIRYYDLGVGTRFLNRLRGGVFGRGVTENISQAYTFLCQSWQPGDEIYIFGYSRGAYTARSLVGLLEIVGLLDHKLVRQPKNITQVVNYLYEYIKYLDKDTQFRNSFEAEKPQKPELPELLKNIPSERQKIPVKFLGVWDTVGSIGSPTSAAWKFRVLTHDVYETLGNSEICNNVEYAYHAMAIDEHRIDFGITPWTYAHDSTDLPPKLQEVEQLWFVGAHGNVGGGIEGNSLSDIPCQWMQEKAKQAGLSFSKDYEIADNVYGSEVADSYAKFAGGFHQLFNDRSYRQISFAGLAEQGGVINEGIHPSVWNFFLNNVAYQPQNIPNEIVAQNIESSSNDNVA